MGLPMIQVVMIAARQVSKPIADTVITYGKNHPGFRNRVLIPIGRGLVNLSTRLQMKGMGLGSPTSLAPVSEARALDQASDFVQQVVLFSYSVGVFASYYFYTKYTTPETLKLEEFEKFQEAVEEEKAQLLARLERLENAIVAHKIKLPPLPERPPQPPPPQPEAPAKEPVKSDPQAASSLSSSGDSSAARPVEPPAPKPVWPATQPQRATFARVSSLPLDSAVRVVYEGGRRQSAE